MVQAETSPSKARVLGFHEDRVPDAQEFYSSEFCVFVAKYALPESIPGLDTDGQTFCSLPQSQSDETLEAAVTEMFSKFGTVFVKIRRDTRNQMPYGFAQFTVGIPNTRTGAPSCSCCSLLTPFQNAQNARTALLKGRGSIILGRACRTERVKGNCTLNGSSTLSKRSR